MNMRTETFYSHMGGREGERESEEEEGGQRERGQRTPKRWKNRKILPSRSLPDLLLAMFSTVIQRSMGITHFGLCSWDLWVAVHWFPEPLLWSRSTVLITSINLNVSLNFFSLFSALWKRDGHTPYFTGFPWKWHRLIHGKCFLSVKSTKCSIFFVSLFLPLLPSSSSFMWWVIGISVPLTNLLPGWRMLGQPGKWDSAVLELKWLVPTKAQA